MRRFKTASAFALVLATMAAVPAGAGPIVFVSGPSPVAIVSGTLTVNGPEVSAGLFLSEAAGGFPSWPGGASQGGFLPSAALRSPAELFAAGLPFVGNSPARPPALPSVPAAPGAPAAPSLTLPLLILGFDLSGQEAQMLFALSLLGSGPVAVQVLSDGFQFTPFEDGGSSPVPEPATVLLLSSGLAGAFLARRRMKKRAR